LAPEAQQLDILRNALLQPVIGSTSGAVGGGSGLQNANSGDGGRDSGDGSSGVGDGGGELAMLQSARSLEDLEYYLEDAFQRAQTFVKKHAQDIPDEKLRTLEVSTAQLYLYTLQ
jgi:hypothetical protein